MKISNNWLKQYIDINLSAEKLEDRLTFAGIEVEAVEQVGKELAQLKVAEIVQKEKHPNAETLSICSVFDGKETLQVVCGAPNCAAGQKIAFAPIGTDFGDFKIKKTKLRGEVSFGMICSEQELGLSDNHDGIMVLDENAEAGIDMATYLGKNDTCFEVEITPNRPDLLGMIGVAKDLSALMGIPTTLPDPKLGEGEGNISTELSLENQEEALCTRYVARMIKGVKIAESPEWLKNRLTSIGLRPVNNVVDITNFVMMEYGHPLHAFDYAKLKNKQIIIRRAKQGEEFPALDENVYKLTNEDLVIADAENPVALAGIIGGENSHITEQTTDIVLEAANFLYSNIRKSSGRLKIFTDSSYRFERDMADETAELVSQRAIELILEIAGGTLVGGKLDSYPNPKELNSVSVRPSRATKILTIDANKDKINAYMQALGLTNVSEDEDLLTFKVPANRKDLTREIDLIEEIIRLHGYNNVKQVLKPQNIMDREYFYTRRKVQDLLVTCGFSEIINWSFGDPEDLNKLNIAENDERRNYAKLKNPLGTSFSIMRSMLIPGVLKNAIHNINHGAKDFKLFEMAKVFTRKDEKLATEKMHISGLLSGALNPTFWKEKSHNVDFFDVKGIVEEILNIVGVTQIKYETSQELFYQNGQAADLYYKKHLLGSFGKIDPKVAEKFGIEQAVYGLDIKFDAVMNLKLMGYPIFKTIPKYPPVLRDLSILVSEEYPVQQIIDTIFQINRKLIHDIVLFDEYKGENVRDGHRSLTFNIVFVSDTKTLTDESTNKILQKIIKRLQNEYQIEMR